MVPLERKTRRLGRTSPSEALCSHPYPQVGKLQVYGEQKRW